LGGAVWIWATTLCMGLVIAYLVMGILYGMNGSKGDI